MLHRRVGNADGMQMCWLEVVVTFYVMASWRGAVSHWAGRQIGYLNWVPLLLWKVKRYHACWGGKAIDFGARYVMNQRRWWWNYGTRFRGDWIILLYLWWCHCTHKFRPERRGFVEVISKTEFWILQVFGSSILLVVLSRISTHSSHLTRTRKYWSCVWSQSQCTSLQIRDDFWQSPVVVLNNNNLVWGHLTNRPYKVYHVS